jgi:hypothetical protein
MEDGDSKINLEENFHGERICKTTYVRDVFQPIWIRHNTVLSLVFDREFVERKLDFVFVIGLMFWVGYLVSQIF